MAGGVGMLWLTFCPRCLPNVNSIIFINNDEKYDSPLLDLWISIKWYLIFLYKKINAIYSNTIMICRHVLNIHRATLRASRLVRYRRPGYIGSVLSLLFLLFDAMTTRS